MRVVDTEDAHALRDPELEHALQLGPESFPVRGLEIERVDVLVFLRRVLRILDRAVGALQKPFRMLAHVGMVGSALEGDVEGDLDAALAGLRDQAPEILERAELRDGSPCGRPMQPPMAQGLPASPSAAFGLLLGPLRSVMPIGWMGGRYSTSKPIAEISGSRASTSANVPCCPELCPAERGNSSYQVEKRARSRSTSIVRGGSCRARSAGPDACLRADVRCHFARATTRSSRSRTGSAMALAQSFKAPRVGVAQRAPQRSSASAAP